MDLSGVSKKVDTNVEYAREMYRLDKKKEELKELEKQLKQSRRSPHKRGLEESQEVEDSESYVNELFSKFPQK